MLLPVAIALGAFEDNYWLFILQMTFIMGMVALGTLIVAGYAREITLMQAGLTGTAIYVSGWAYRSNCEGLKWPLPVAVAFGTASWSRSRSRWRWSVRRSRSLAQVVSCTGGSGC
ncbi:MAG TPA: hypothetical protein VHU88_02740 [Sporichthyaceae bacterium]|nr:hypothetical protein [Sporichthyaceae bacterium]